MNRDKARSDGFLLLCLGALVFVSLGLLMLAAQGGAGIDFRMAHASGRCLLEHRDPYKQADILQAYTEDGGKLPPVCCGDTQAVLAESHYPYLPTFFVVTVPLALVPVSLAFPLWTALAAISFLGAAAMVWKVGKEHAPLLTGGLLCALLVNSGSLIGTGNAGSLALSLGVIAACCFLSGSAPVLGIFCMALSLAIKPHDAAFLWLALFLFGGVFRKRALQSAGVLACGALPVLLWLWHIAPQWRQELRSNMAALFAPGGLNDPSPSAVLKGGSLMFTNLQSAFSLIRDDPRFYNAATYAICLLMLIAFVTFTLRLKSSVGGRWLALAFMSALTLLPVYHRQYDAKLLILTIPACALLWSRGGKIGKFALVVTTLGLLMASDLPWAFYIAFTTNLKLTGIWFQLYFLSRALPVPCTFALVAVFFLAAYGSWLRSEQSVPRSIKLRSDATV